MILLYSYKKKIKKFKEESTMKNINTYIVTAIVSLMLVVATAFLMTAADAPIREAGMYLPIVFGAITGWSASKAGLLELDREERASGCVTHAAA